MHSPTKFDVVMQKALQLGSTMTAGSQITQHLKPAPRRNQPMTAASKETATLQRQRLEARLKALLEPTLMILSDAEAHKLYNNSQEYTFDNAPTADDLSAINGLSALPCTGAVAAHLHWLQQFKPFSNGPSAFEAYCQLASTDFHDTPECALIWAVQDFIRDEKCDFFPVYAKLFQKVKEYAAVIKKIQLAAQKTTQLPLIAKEKPFDYSSYGDKILDAEEAPY